MRVPDYHETQGTLTNTTVDLPAKPRRGLIVANPSDTVMTVRVGATATATAGIPIQAGDSIILRDGNAPVQSVSVFCAGTSKAYTIYEW
jgi:hypothetical protein